MNIDPIVVKVLETVKSHELSTGAYARWTIPEPGRNMGVNEYGCADAANLLYTVGAPVRDPAERAKWVETMQNMQSPDTGLFSEPTHHPFHTTAHCVAALELFDALPRYELTEMKKYLDTEKLHELFWAGFCDDEGAKTAIGKVWKDDHYLCDTHTAVAWDVAQQYKQANPEHNAVVVLSTASPYKFPAAVLEGIGEKAEGDEFDVMEQLHKVTGVPVPKNLADLRSRAVRHRDVIDRGEMLDYVLGKAAAEK